MFGKKTQRINELTNQVNSLSLQLKECAENSNKQAEEYNRLHAHYTALKQFMDEHGGTSAWDQKNTNDHYRSEYEVLVQLHDEEEKRHQETVGQYESRAEKLLEQCEELSKQRVLVESNCAHIESPAEKSVALSAEIKDTKEKIKSLVKEKRAINASTFWEGVGDKVVARKIIPSIQKLALRTYNSEAQEILSKITPANYDTSLARLVRKAEQIEKLGADCRLKISTEYQMLWAKQLRLASEFAQNKQLERELERERKAELREQAKAQRELEAERNRLEKEEKHYVNAIRKLKASGRETEIESLQQELEQIRKGIANVDYRAANIRAGYVYVISNIGSFGERMVKIGMTRRLEPMDRVRELSDASVPFNFDVHALFFSDDAVGVETQLHHKFADQRVNLVNQRREFFSVTPGEVKEALADIAGNLLEFVDHPEAEQYRESQSLRAQALPGQ